LIELQPARQRKWEQCAQPVIYLGILPKHAIGAGSHDSTSIPQFNLKFDDLFEKVLVTKPNSQVHKSSWQTVSFWERRKKPSRASESHPIPPLLIGPDLLIVKLLCFMTVPLFSMKMMDTLLKK
jgi:hypothetical protein